MTSTYADQENEARIALLRETMATLNREINEREVEHVKCWQELQRLLSERQLLSADPVLASEAK